MVSALIRRQPLRLKFLPRLDHGEYGTFRRLVIKVDKALMARYSASSLNVSEPLVAEGGYCISKKSRSIHWLLRRPYCPETSTFLSLEPGSWDLTSYARKTVDILSKAAEGA